MGFETSARVEVFVHLKVTSTEYLDHLHPTLTSGDSTAGSDGPRDNAVKKQRFVRFQCGDKGQTAQLGPNAEDCEEVDEIGAEHSSDAVGQFADQFDLTSQVWILTHF